MLAPVLNILPLATIVRERTLPVAGKVNATLQRQPYRCDCRSRYSREHVLFDVARTFSVSVSAADKMIKVNTNDRVMQGALVAESGGLMSRSIKRRAGRRDHRGRRTGSLMEVGDTRIGIARRPAGCGDAGFAGTWCRYSDCKALIQGVWGNGRIDNGLMVNSAEARRSAHRRPARWSAWVGHPRRACARPGDIEGCGGTACAA